MCFRNELQTTFSTGINRAKDIWSLNLTFIFHWVKFCGWEKCELCIFPLFPTCRSSAHCILSETTSVFENYNSIFTFKNQNWIQLIQRHYFHIEWNLSAIKKTLENIPSFYPSHIFLNIIFQIHVFSRFEIIINLQKMWIVKAYIEIMCLLL